MAVAGMVLGIVSVVTLMIPLLGAPMAIFMAAVGLPLSAVARRKAQAAGAPTGISTAGLVLNIIALGLALVTLMACGAIMGAGMAELQ